MHRMLEPKAGDGWFCVAGSEIWVILVHGRQYVQTACVI